MVAAKEIYHGLIVLLGSTLLGISMGFSSPVSEYFQANWKVSATALNWFSNITTIVGIFSPFLPVLLCKFIGKRLCYSIFCIAAVITYLLFILVKENRFWLAILLRGIVGVENGGFSVICPTLLIDVASLNFTGLFGNLHQVGIVIGIILMRFLGMYCNWQILCFITAGVSLIAACLIWLIPETSARKIEKQESFWTDTNIANMVICITVMIIQQFSGISAILTNLSEDLENAGIKFKPENANVLTMFLQLVGVIICGFIIDRLGRMALFCGSSLGCGIILYLYSSTLKYTMAGWLPIFFVAMYLFFFGLALGPLPWFIAPEMFAIQDRIIVASSVACANQLGSYFIGYLFPLTKEKMGLGFACYFFATFCILAAVFGFSYLYDPKVEKKVELVWIQDDSESNVEFDMN